MDQQKVDTVAQQPPLVEAIESEDGCLSFWCPYCVRWHYHGQGEGHRVAHCDTPPTRPSRKANGGPTASPYLQTGYELRSLGRGVALSKRRPEYRLL
jgi:hypothetical protein